MGHLSPRSPMEANPHRHPSVDRKHLVDNIVHFLLETLKVSETFRVWRLMWTN